jgi:hypothetical protein
MRHRAGWCVQVRAPASPIPNAPARGIVNTPILGESQGKTLKKLDSEYASKIPVAGLYGTSIFSLA